MVLIKRFASLLSAVAVAWLIALSLPGEANSFDQPAMVLRKAHQHDDGLYIASRPELFAGKAVRIHCERLRNLEMNSISCWMRSGPIVVDARLLDMNTLRYAHENCRGMLSSCKGMVTGVVALTRGQAHIIQAEIIFATE